MPDFAKIPEALDFIVGQAWLSPVEPVVAAPRGTPTPMRLGWRAALREIAAIVRRA